MENKVSRLKQISLLLAVILPIIACVILSKSLVLGFLTGLFINVNILRTCDFKYRELFVMIGEGILECKMICLLILLIGASVSIWLASGVVPALIYYGSHLLKDSNFIFMAFIIVMICSTFIGSAIATISTIGIAIIGIGVSFKIPLHILLGVVVSAAFLADKISPISGLLNLTIESSGSNYKDTLKSMMSTLIPTLIISSVIYYIIGLKYMDASDISELIKIQEMIRDSFNISPFLMLIPVVVVILSIMGFGALKSITFACLIGIVVTYAYQGVSIYKISEWIFFGYKGESSYEYINKLLFSGGVIAMIEVIFIVMGAVSLGAIFEKTGILKSLLKEFINKRLTKNSLIIKTSITSILLTVLTCDQTMGIIIPSRLFKEKFKSLGIKKEVLIRTISDSGTIIAPLMPWNVNAIIISSVTGISSGYAVFSVLCFIFPLISIVVAIIENNLSKNSQLQILKKY